MNENINKSIKQLSTLLIANEALKRGVKIKYINDYQKKEAFLELSYKNHYEYLVGQKSSKTSSTADFAVNNKALTKSLLSIVKINIAKGKLFNKNNDIADIYKYMEKIGYPVVIKKNNGAHGNLVFIGMNNKKMREEAIKKVFKENEEVLIEKEFKGKEYRFTASGEKVLAVMYREPANVVGDGIHTVEELIKIKNKDPRRGDGYEKVLCKIKIDKTIKHNLAEQKLDLDSVVPKDRKVYLRKNSNLSTGGDSIDLTDETHMEFKKIAVKAVNAIPGLAYGGVDLMSNIDISKKPKKNNYIILEINSSPGISMHYDPIEGKTRDVAKDIIDLLFPETKGKYVEK